MRKRTEFLSGTRCMLPRVAEDAITPRFGAHRLYGIEYFMGFLKVRTRVPTNKFHLVDDLEGKLTFSQ